LVLVVVGGAEQDALRAWGHGRSFEERKAERREVVGDQALTPPEERPVCQKPCRNRRATINGMIDTSDPVMTLEQRA
jgi:plasmid stability protein